MKVTKTKIPEVLLIEPDVFEDSRGFFMETWQKRKFFEAGINYDFVQDNHSRSIKGTLRGLHFQVSPKEQGKLVRVTVGEVFDVAVDIREQSSTFGMWVAKYLSARNKRQLWVPPGFAHGFYVVSDEAEVQYKCTNYYDPASERTIAWNDPYISIKWPNDGVPPILSSRDSGARTLLETLKDG